MKRKAPFIDRPKKQSEEPVDLLLDRLTKDVNIDFMFIV